MYDICISALYCCVKCRNAAGDTEIDACKFTLPS